MLAKKTVGGNLTSLSSASSTASTNQKISVNSQARSKVSEAPKNKSALKTKDITRIAYCGLQIDRSAQMDIKEFKDIREKISKYLIDRSLQKKHNITNPNQGKVTIDCLGLYRTHNIISDDAKT